MKVRIKKETAKLLSAVAVLVMIACFVPQIAAPVYASSGDPAIAARTEIVLKDTANSNDAQTVWYAGKQWWVISYDGNGNRFTSPEGEMTLFAYDDLGRKQFNPDSAAPHRNQYKDSYLQKGINELYATLFSEGEQNAVQERTLEVDEFSLDNKDAEGVYYTKGVSGEKTTGCLWPLSTAEALQLPTLLKNSSGDWWLRSPGETEDVAGMVNTSNTVIPIGLETHSPFGLRPAFDLKLDSVLFAAAADEGKKSGDPGPDALTPIGTNSDNEWKLTVRSGHDSFSVTDCTATEEEVTFDYTGAAVGTEEQPEYISVLIASRPVTDSTSRVTYYGRIKECTSSSDASGKLTVNIAGKLGINDSLYVFNEQYNGDKKTDYASDLQRLKFPREDTAAVKDRPALGGGEYCGTEQPLLASSGEAEGGLMQYALGADAETPPTSGWSTSIPTGCAAGTYYVWYMVDGDNLHNDSAPECIPVEISKKLLTITARDQHYVYNGYEQGEGDPAYDSPEEIKKKVEANGLQGSDMITSLVLSGTAKEVGVYPDRIEITSVTVGDATDNYDIACFAGKLTITKADIDPITPSDETVDITPIDPEIPVVNTAKIMTQGNIAKKLMKVKFPADASVTNYRIEYRLAGKSSWKSGWSAGTDMYVIRGLKKSSLCEFRIAGFVKQERDSWVRGEWSKISYRYMSAVPLKSAKAGHKSITVSWAKDKKASGYQIQYSLKKSMAGAKTITVKGKAKTKYTIKGLKSGKKYYVKVRPVKTKAGKKYLGILTKAKAAKVR